MSDKPGSAFAQREGRLLLVSNRLPITTRRSEDGKYSFSLSSGGLVTGLSGLSKSTTFQWYGWPGLEVPENEIDQLKAALKDTHNAVPVMLADDLADKHYNGFSSILFLILMARSCLANMSRFDPLASLPLPSGRGHLQ